MKLFNSCWVRRCIAFLLILGPSLALKAEDSRLREVTIGPQISLTPERLEKVFAELPQARQLIADLLADDNTPNFVRRNLASAFKDDTRFINIENPESRENFGLPETTGAQARFITSVRTFKYSGQGQTLNEASAEVGHGTEGMSFVVLTPDAGGDHPHVQFTLLIHELAHLRFNHFLERHLEYLAKKYPIFFCGDTHLV